MTDISPQQRAEKLRTLFAEWEAEAALLTQEQRETESAAWEEMLRDMQANPVQMRRVDVSDND